MGLQSVWMWHKDKGCEKMEKVIVLNHGTDCKVYNLYRLRSEICGEMNIFTAHSVWVTTRLATTRKLNRFPYKLKESGKCKWWIPNKTPTHWWPYCIFFFCFQSFCMAHAMEPLCVRGHFAWLSAARMLHPQGKRSCLENPAVSNMQHPWG